MTTPGDRQETQHANADAFQTGESSVMCSHCVAPAGNKRDDAALQEANSTQRAHDLTAPVSLATGNQPALLKAKTWVAKAHGPPRDAGPLYVLINVFRI